MSEKKNEFENLEVNKYKIGQTLGRGASGTVCVARNMQTGQVYACKIILKQSVADRGDMDRFQREINVMAFIIHENIVCLHDFFWDSKYFYLIMDYCPGGELFDFLVRNGKSDEKTAAFVFYQIASALKICHESGVAHRDLKPENVLITTFPYVKLSDFGLSSYNSDVIQNQTFCGSPCYCSPECLCRIPYNGKLSDVWSLGVILYALVVGDLPWNTSNSSIMIHQIVKGSISFPVSLSENLRLLLMGMLKVNPNERLSLDEALAHPWILEHIDGFPRFKSESRHSQGPISLKRIALEYEKYGKITEKGIVSPFGQIPHHGQSSSGVIVTGLPHLLAKNSILCNLPNGKCSSSSITKKLSHPRRSVLAANVLFRRHTRPSFEDDDIADV